MEQDVTRNQTGIEMSQASLQGFFKNFCSAKMKTEKFAEEISEYEVRDCQDCNVLSKEKNCQETGQEEKGDRREFFIFFRFIKLFYCFEEKSVYSFGEKAN